MSTRPTRWQLVGGLMTLIVVGWLIARGVRDLSTTRGAVGTFARAIASANAGDLATVRSLCSDRYLATHPLEPAREGGVVGFPRQIHPNFQVWVQGDEVWLCAANRAGTVYRFVRESGRWKFAGPAGVLRGDGAVMSLGTDPGRPAKIP